MIRHLLKLVWNRKRKNTILIIEIIFSFLVMFVVLSFGTNYLWNYSKDSGFVYKDVYVLNANWWNVSNIADSTVVKTLSNCKDLLKGFPEIKKISFASNNVAFASSQWTSSYKYKKINFHADNFYVDSNFFSLMEIPIRNGKNFSGLRSSKYKRIAIVNEKFKQQIEDKKSCIGDRFDNEDYTYPIVGTIGNYKYYNDFVDLRNQIFILNDPFDSTQSLTNTILIKVKSGTGAEFEQKLLARMHQAVPLWDFYLSLMENNRDEVNRQVLIPFIIGCVIAGFLVLNVALGLFGVLWYNVNRRKPEIGLRRSLGSTSKKIYTLVIGETWMLTMVSIFLGLIIALQVPMFGLFNLSWAIYLVAIGLDIIFVFVLVSICALYPSHLAAGIQPMEALRSE